MLHGIQGTATCWTEVVARLPADFCPLTPNLRGRGQAPSPADASEYGLDAFAGDLAEVLGGIPGPVWLCGWSMGVLVILAYVARYGLTRVDGIVFAAGTARPAYGIHWFTGETVDAIAIEAEERRLALGLTESATSTAVAGAWLSVRAADFSTILPLIARPVCVLHGELDDQCPLAHGEALAAALPEAEFVRWGGGHHNLMADDPDRFAEFLTHFIRAHRGHQK
jgi:pimeloyl-ACP methyl ester carboxylesterase